MTLKTARLLLRAWRPQDWAPFAALNADPEVMRYFPAPLSAAESDGFAGRCQEVWRTQGFGNFAVERKEDGVFLGYVGLSRPRFEAAFTPCVEIGWRLARHCWGQGFAPEAACEVMAWAFRDVGLTEVLSWTAVGNLPSIRVMEKVGMERRGAFEHPSLSEGHWLRPHVLYGIRSGKT